MARQIFKQIFIRVNDLDRYTKVVNHQLDYLVLRTNVGRVFFTHSLSNGNPDAAMLSLFASMLKAGKVDKLVVCYPDRIANSKFRFVLKHHLLRSGRGEVRTHDNEGAARNGYPTRMSNGSISLLLSIRK